MGSCVPRQFISAALDPHCWKATSFAAPEYVMDFRSPNAFCALAITVLASCAMALAHSEARQIANTASFFKTASPLIDRRLVARVERTRPEYSSSTRSLVGLDRTIVSIPLHGPHPHSFRHGGEQNRGGRGGGAAGQRGQRAARELAGRRGRGISH